MMFLEGESPSEEQLKELIRRGTLNISFILVLVGIAFNNKGIQPLFDAIIDYMPSLPEDEAITRDSDDREEIFRASSDK